MPHPSDFGDFEGHDVLLDDEMEAQGSSEQTPKAAQSHNSRPNSRGAGQHDSRPGSREGRPGSRGNSAGRLSAGWHRQSRRSARPSSSVAGSETGSAIGDDDIIDLDTAMVSAASLRRGLAQAGAWTIDGKPQPLPPDITPAMQLAVDRMEARKRGEPVSEVESPHGSPHSSRPMTPTGLSVIESQNNISFVESLYESDSGKGDEKSVSSSALQSKKGYPPLFEEGTKSILPTLVDGDSWFKDEESALAKLRAIAPMVDEWRSRESEDGFSIPTIVEELVEKNGLAAAL